MNLLKYTILLVVCFLLQPFSASGREPAPTLRVGVHVAYPPFSMTDGEGNLTGFDVDVTHALCKKMGERCVVMPMRFADMIPALVSGELDMAVGGMTPTPERMVHVDFTDKYFRSVSIYVEKRTSFAERHSGPSPGMRIGVQKGTIQEAYLYEEYGPLISVTAVATFEEVFALLADEKVDIILVGGLPGYLYLKSEKGRGFERSGSAVDFGDEGNWASIAISRTKPGLREKVNAALLALQRNGEFGKINRKYFDFPID